MDDITCRLLHSRRAQKDTWLILSCMVAFMLQVPVYSAHLKGIFSAGARVMVIHRKSMTPEIIEDQVYLNPCYCCKKGLRGKLIASTQNILNIQSAIYLHN